MDIDHKLFEKLYQQAYSEVCKPYYKMLDNGSPVIIHNVSDQLEAKTRMRLCELVVEECIKVMKDYDSGAGEAWLFEADLKRHFERKKHE